MWLKRALLGCWWKFIVCMCGVMILGGHILSYIARWAVGSIPTHKKLLSRPQMIVLSICRFYCLHKSLLFVKASQNIPNAKDGLQKTNNNNNLTFHSHCDLCGALAQDIASITTEYAVLIILCSRNLQLVILDDHTFWQSAKIFAILGLKLPLELRCRLSLSYSKIMLFESLLTF